MRAASSALTRRSSVGTHASSPAYPPSESSSTTAWICSCTLASAAALERARREQLGRVVDERELRVERVRLLVQREDRLAEALDPRAQLLLRRPLHAPRLARARRARERAAAARAAAAAGRRRRRFVVAAAAALGALAEAKRLADARARARAHGRSSAAMSRVTWRFVAYHARSAARTAIADG